MISPVINDLIFTLTLSLDLLVAICAASSSRILNDISRIAAIAVRIAVRGFTVTVLLDLVSDGKASAPAPST